MQYQLVKPTTSPFVATVITLKEGVLTGPGYVRTVNCGLNVFHPPLVFKVIRDLGLFYSLGLRVGV
jgi:hypothetical protein